MASETHKSEKPILVAPDDPEREARRRRLLISGVLVTGLIAVAYSEPVHPVRIAMKADGVSIFSLALFVVYFLTVFRFFIGDILHLEEDQLTDVRAQVKWFWDMSFIVLECIVLIFLGDVTSLEESKTAHLGFFDLLAILFVIDIAWILSMGALNFLSERRPAGRISSLWKREIVPWGWAILNTGQLALLLLDGYTTRGSISAGKLWLLVGVNLFAFAVDVFALNYYLKIRKRKKGESLNAATGAAT